MNRIFTRSSAAASLVAVTMALHAAPASAGQRVVYGVPPARTTVVVAPAPRAVVVAPAPVAAVALPSGYIAVLPTDYRIVTVSGARYYYAGGVHYRAQFYQGRTCYVRVRL